MEKYLIFIYSSHSGVVLTHTCMVYYVLTHKKCSNSNVDDKLKSLSECFLQV